MTAQLTKESEESAHRVKEDVTVPSDDTDAKISGSDTGVPDTSTIDHSRQEEQVPEASNLRQPTDVKPKVRLSTAISDSHWPAAGRCWKYVLIPMLIVVLLLTCVGIAMTMLRRPVDLLDEVCKGRDIYAVFGKSGVGKSSFIATLGGKDDYGKPPKICRDPHACIGTAEPGYYEVTHNNTQICLLDLPGFDDGAGTTDTQILRRLFFHIPDTKQVKGLLFLYDISVRRVGRLSQVHIELFRHLCGESNLDRTTFVTVSHRAIPTLKDREDEYMHAKAMNDIYWQPMIQKGSRITFFDGSRRSAEMIISELASKPRQFRLNDDPNLPKEASFKAILGGYLDDGVKMLMKADQIVSHAGHVNAILKFWP